MNDASVSDAPATGGRAVTGGPHRPVGELALARPVEVSADASLRDAARAMRLHGASWVLVKGGLPGILTERDITRAVAEGTTPSDPAAVVVTLSPVTVGTMTPLGRAAALMVRDGIRHLPVLNADGAVVGVLSSRDVLRILLGEGEWSDWLADFDALAADGG